MRHILWHIKHISHCSHKNPPACHQLTVDQSEVLAASGNDVYDLLLQQTAIFRKIKLKEKEGKEKKIKIK